MSNKFYYFEEKDLVDILDKVYEEGWSGSLEIKESFISYILKEHCKESEVPIESREIEVASRGGETRIYETTPSGLTLKATDLNAAEDKITQMSFNFEDVDHRSNDIVMDGKDLLPSSWSTDTVFWTGTEAPLWEEFYSDNNLNNHGEENEQSDGC